MNAAADSSSARNRAAATLSTYIFSHMIVAGGCKKALCLALRCPTLPRQKKPDSGEDATASCKLENHSGNFKCSGNCRVVVALLMSFRRPQPLNKDWAEYVSSGQLTTANLIVDKQLAGLALGQRMQSPRR